MDNARRAPTPSSGRGRERRRQETSPETVATRLGPHSPQRTSRPKHRPPIARRPEPSTEVDEAHHQPRPFPIAHGTLSPSAGLGQRHSERAFGASSPSDVTAPQGRYGALAQGSGSASPEPKSTATAMTAMATMET